MRNCLPNVRHHSQTLGEVPTHRLPNFPGWQSSAPSREHPSADRELESGGGELRGRRATVWSGWRVRGRAICTPLSPKFSLPRLPLPLSLSLTNFHSSYLSQTVCCINSDTFPHRGIKTAQPDTQPSLAHKFHTFLELIFPETLPYVRPMHQLCDHILLVTGGIYESSLRWIIIREFWCHAKWLMLQQQMALQEKLSEKVFYFKE